MRCFPFWRGREIACLLLAPVVLCLTSCAPASRKTSALIPPATAGTAATNRTIAPEPPPVSTAPQVVAAPTLASLARFRQEETERPHIEAILGYLTDIIGPRLTGSPHCQRASQWACDQLSSWGLTNAHLEPWGSLGKGWTLERFAVQVVAPQCIPLVAWPKGATAGLDQPLTAEVVYLDASKEAELEKYKGKLKGAIVMVSLPRDVPARFEPTAYRMTESNLLALAKVAPTERLSPYSLGGPPRLPQPEPLFRRAPTNQPAGAEGRLAKTSESTSTNRPARPPRPLDTQAKLKFAAREGAAVALFINTAGDGIWNGDALTVVPRTNAIPDFMRSEMTNAPANPPQIVIAAEQYNRLVHLAQAGEKVRMSVDIKTRFTDTPATNCNIIAEIPGSDLKEQIVMLGAHLDSASPGTGATDDGAGVAVCMEAVRLIQSLKLTPRRTIRIGLWTGEEQGLRGSRKYVADHFGYFTNQIAVTTNAAADSPTNRPITRRILIRHPEYDRISAYYNLDYGAGRIRGIFLQSNTALNPVFAPWLQALAPLGATTLCPGFVGGTDHLSFDDIRIPGFQFIQDPVEYWRSYHTSLDVRERAPLEDLQQAAVVMATFVYETAMRDEKLPRRPLPTFREEMP